MELTQLSDFVVMLKDIVQLRHDGVQVLDDERLRCEMIDHLAIASAFANLKEVRDTSRWIIRESANELGITPCSIYDLYKARANGEYGKLCVAAVNHRGVTYDSARAMFRAAKQMNAGPFIFEITRSEIGYSAQSPAEYAASVLAAAVRECYEGPVFLQADHFQIYPDAFREDPEAEMKEIKKLIGESVEAGFYNIDIDASGLVDNGKPSARERQLINSKLTAELTAFIREIEPEGVCISIGAYLSKPGAKNNSTVEDLDGFMEGYNEMLCNLMPGATGLSKVSVHTGTVTGGVLQEDGSMAKLDIDFDVHRRIGKACREKYGLAGTVQQGASTLPDEDFHLLKDSETIEVHHGTAFQNLIMDHDLFPMSLRYRIYVWLRANCGGQRRPDQNPLQFLYKTRKKGWGVYKQETWMIPDDDMAVIMNDLQRKFHSRFSLLGLAETQEYVKKYIKPVLRKQTIPKIFKSYLKEPDDLLLEGVKLVK